MKLGLFWRVTPVYVIVITLVALPIWQRHNAEVNAREEIAIAQNYSLSSSNTDKNVEGIPKRIIIPSINLILPVELGVYDVNTSAWNVSESTANYAFNTAKNNTHKGGTLIYGHWTPQVFGPTNNLKPGHKVIVITDKGNEFTYIYKNDQTLNPTDTDLFANLKIGEPKLALMTCKGLWAQERRVMYFDLAGVK
jgi:LPXTG-site transpeptidase (sortase) family protein